MFPMDKYRFYEGSGKVIAVSTFAGKKVRGVAKCDPRDDFDQEKGKTLAAARCAQKIAYKRQARAKRQYMAAQAKLKAALAETERMRKYVDDSIKAAEAMDVRLADLLNAM